MSKPFDLEAVKAGKPFRRSAVGHMDIQYRFIGVRNDGTIVYECRSSGLCGAGWSLSTDKPEFFEMLPEKRVYKGLLVNFTKPREGELSAWVVDDNEGNREWIADGKVRKIIKEFTIEYDED